MILRSFISGTVYLLNLYAVGKIYSPIYTFKIWFGSFIAIIGATSFLPGGGATMHRGPAEWPKLRGKNAQRPEAEGAGWGEIF